MFRMASKMARNTISRLRGTDLTSGTHSKRSFRRLLSWTLVFDVLVGMACMFGSVRLRYFYWQNPIENVIDIRSALIFGGSLLVMLVFLKTHRAVWRFATLKDIINLLYAVVLAVLITTIIVFTFLDRGFGFPRSAAVLAAGATFVVMTFARAAFTLINRGDLRTLFSKTDPNGPIAILVGSAQSVHRFLKKARENPKASTYRPIASITSETTFHGKFIDGIAVIGGLEALEAEFSHLTEKHGIAPIIIDVETRKTRRMFEAYEIVRAASRVGARVFRIQPGRNDLFTPLEISDLLERTPREMNTQPILDFINGRRILLTGAGGSIGSELMRHILTAAPENLALIDISELALFNIRQELKDYQTPPYPNSWTTYLGNVLDKRRMAEIFALEKPDIVIHAAALKHVVFGEENPLETLRTNILGTQIVHDLASEHGASSFTLISTDKACRPTSFMGASKRVAELIVLSDKISKTPTSSCAVRFGNVFVSTGSVVHIFQKQIENGGPVKVTHPDVQRYFMTTKEATALVLQAAAYSAKKREKGGNIYTLEMGRSVKIIDLARRLIRLRGLVPEKDIEIEFTGLTQGEKLSEDLYERLDQCKPTDLDGIFNYCENGKHKTSQPHVQALIEALETRDNGAAKTHLGVLFPNIEGLAPPAKSKPAGLTRDLSAT